MSDTTQPPELGRDLPFTDLAAADASPAALDVLLLLARDPMACETAEGFAWRLHRPVAEVRRALSDFVERGLLNASRQPGACPQTSYWLACEVPFLQSLQRLARAYSTDRAARRTLRQAFSRLSA